MPIEEGVVLETSETKALVRIQQSSSCATCKSRESCDISSGNHTEIEVSNELQAKIGDRVQISLPESTLLKLSLLVYILPVIALVAGSCVGAGLATVLDTDSTLTSVIAGCSAMAMVFYVLRRLDGISDFRKKYYPRMTRILLSANLTNPHTL